MAAPVLQTRKPWNRMRWHCSCEGLAKKGTMPSPTPVPPSRQTLTNDASIERSGDPPRAYPSLGPLFRKRAMNPDMALKRPRALICDGARAASRPSNESMPRNGGRRPTNKARLHPDGRRRPRHPMNPAFSQTGALLVRAPAEPLTCWKHCRLAVELHSPCQSIKRSSARSAEQPLPSTISID